MRYEKLTTDGEALVLDTNHEFSKQFVGGRPEDRLANEVKKTQSKNWAGFFCTYIFKK